MAPIKKRNLIGDVTLASSEFLRPLLDATVVVSCYSWSRSHGFIKITKSAFSFVLTERERVPVARIDDIARTMLVYPVNGMQSDDSSSENYTGWPGGQAGCLKGYNFVAITGRKRNHAD